MKNLFSVRRKSESDEGDLAFFLSRWVRAPHRIGALAPSSRELGREMARAIDARNAEYVVELGGGTGRITGALIEAGVAPERLFVIESDQELAALLKKRFPKANILKGDARHSPELLKPFGITSVSAVISGLPLLSMPLDVRRSIVERAFSLMGKDGVFVQFTYGPVSPVMQRRLGLQGEVTGRVWRNFPPASVWRYRRMDSAASR